MPLEVSYVLPLKAEAGDDMAELASYVRSLGELAEVIVVDGSSEAVFEHHCALWGDAAIHIAPRPELHFLNGKVNGVLTGVERASNEAVIVADDDVRYDAASMKRVAAYLRSYCLVRPQNYFDPLPWHALWDSGRTLLNRALGSDYPGTLGVRRSVFLDAGGYDGDAMFENLEMIRTIEEAGGTSVSPLDLFVRRIPPPVSLFIAQRTRQAYDDLAQPHRLLFFLTLGPVAVDAAIKKRGDLLAAGVAATVAVAEIGRHRAHGREVFPFTASLMAPLWMIERAICVWIALAHRAAGGVPYRGRRIPVAAHPRRVIRRRLAARRERSLL